MPACTFTAPTGKQFKGWVTSADGAVIDATTYNVTENVELFAIWEDISAAENYGITIADKDGNGVMIDEENYTDVLGDGTFSYNPTTNTLTITVLLGKPMQASIWHLFAV